MKNKSTHRGHCQACGRHQMLPNGLLAKHGYTVEGGYFNGTCFGSKHKPMEQDTTIAHETITFCLKQAENIKARASNIRKPSTKPEAWFSRYYPSVGRIRSHYSWEWTKIDYAAWNESQK